MVKISKVISTIVLAIFFTTFIANAAVAEDSSTGQAAGAQKLGEAKLKVCQIREINIQKRNNKLASMSKNMLVRFDGIAVKVETYYTGKAVPNGKSISNYDALVAEIATKKSAVQDSLDKANTDAAAFNCTSDDPKGQLTQFRTDMQAVKQGLKDYRTSIKNLIVAIRSVTGKTNSTSN